jgi:hypothetical protein
MYFYSHFGTQDMGTNLSSDVCLIQNLHVWLGGLFIAEAYVTATRQYVAQANDWSLEELQLEAS